STSASSSRCPAGEVREGPAPGRGRARSSFARAAAVAARAVSLFHKEMDPMKTLRIVTLGLALALLAGTALAEQHGGSIKVGPQVGETLAGPFHPLNVT